MFRPARFVTASLLVAALFLLSGCVYLRLLQVKHQMAKFDENFGVETEDGVRLVCRNPVLLSDDLRWIGLAPESTDRRGTSTQWQVRWVKQMPPEIRENGTYDIVLGLQFVDDRLADVSIPERYFAAMPKKLLIDLLRSLGGAKVDKSGRAIEALLSTNKPDLPGIEKLLGRPSQTLVTDAETVYRYRYVPSTAKGLAKAAVFDIAVHFENGSDELLRWEGTTPVGKIGFNFEKTRSASGSSAARP